MRKLFIIPELKSLLEADKAEFTAHTHTNVPTISYVWREKTLQLLIQKKETKEENSEVEMICKKNKRVKFTKSWMYWG